MAAPSTQRYGWLKAALVKANVAGAAALPDEMGDDIGQAWEFAGARCHVPMPVLANHVAEYYGLQTWHVEDLRSDIVRLIPEHFCRHYKVLAVDRRDGKLLVATAEPDQPEMVRQLKFVSDLPVEFVVSTPMLIAVNLMSAYSNLQSIEDNTGVFNLDKPLGNDVAASVRFVNLMLSSAIERRATDVHLQPLMGGGEARYRIDGVLNRMGLMPRAALERAVGRVKAVAGMDSADELRPQDGHVRVVRNGEHYDLRLSTVPVDGIEKLVIRFLARLTVSSVSQLGIATSELTGLSALLDHGMGLVLVTGPTGSGKTTTLYAALHEKNHAEVNIVTVEDPVEYHIPRLTQIEVNPKVGLTFATALRSVLRQDPNIVLIGEIRDSETAEIAVRAAMTGHLVLATLHTNDAISAIARLKDLGISDTLLSETLIGVTAQRLVRKICPACAVEASDPLTPLEQWLKEHTRVQKLLRPVGCGKCEYRGYKGRVVVCQVFAANPRITEEIANGSPRAILEPIAVEYGMRSLAASALERIIAEETTAEETQRVVGHLMWSTLARELNVPSPITGPTLRTEISPVPRGCVLLVARYEKSREAIKSDIESLGYEVFAVEGAAQGSVKLSQRTDFALIVADLEDLIPEPLQALLDVRGVLASAALPVIALTTTPTSEIARKLARYDEIIVVPPPSDPRIWGVLIREAIAVRAD